MPPAASIFSTALREYIVDAHGERHRELAAAEDLDRRAGVLDDALGDERLGRDLVARRERVRRGGRR